MEKSSSETRRYVILKEIYKKKVVSNEDLKDKFGVSLVTIRKDLAELESLGLVNRTFGGAVPIITSSDEEIITQDASSTIEERSERNAITKYVVEKRLIKDGNILFMDGGIIINMLARRLSDKKIRHITVITNAVNVANKLASQANVILTGGDLRDTQGLLVGNLPKQTIDHYTVDLAFIDVDGVSFSSGLWAKDEVQAEIKKRMIKGAKQIIIMIHHSKLGHEVGQLFATFNVEKDNLKLMVKDFKDEKKVSIDLLDLPNDYKIPSQDDPIQNWFKKILREKGIDEALWVKEKAGGRFEIIDGKRRYLAAKSLANEGLSTFSSIPIKFEKEPFVKRPFKIITSSSYFRPDEEKKVFLNEKRRFIEVASNTFVDIAD
jgi:DeoR/GlpR family transcriptional regulator of sugar metabolism